MEQLTAVVQETTFRNDDNGYTVLRVASGRAQQTVVGVLPQLSPGENVTFEGDWQEHPVYGRQFGAKSCQITPPTGLSAIEKYLGSGLIRGVGPSTARRIVQAFGEKALDVLDAHPERLSEVSGIGARRAEMILQSYAEQVGLRRALVFLQNHGMSPGLAMRVARYYGEDAVELVRANPYRMVMDIEGVGFLTADRMALSMGVDAHSEFRIRAALFYLLGEAAAGGGHTYLPRELLLERACAMLGMERELVEPQITQSLLEKTLMAFSLPDCGNALCLPAFFHAESEIALRLQKLMRERPYKRVKGLSERIRRYEQAQGVQFSALQKRAIQSAVEEGVLVVTGGPGTGKTTIIRCIISLLRDENDILLCAPTGRAAKRMSEATGCEARTLHRLLEYVPGEGFKRNADDPLLYDMIIVDEASMVDVPLLHALLAAIPAGTRLIMVGDSDQLPSVGPGDALRDIIASGVVRVVRLTEIFRQAQQSLIVTNAHRINAGRMPLLDNGAQSDFRFEEYQSQEQALERVLGLCAHPDASLPVGEPLMDIQVLAPMKKGPLGVYNLNARLQAALNPPSPDKAEHAFGERILRVGDKVMQVQNNYKVEWTRRGPNGASIEGAGAFNGDLGTVYRIDNGARRFSILFDDDRLAHYEFTQSDEIELAYCISIHKSQGSEFPVVILPLCGGPPVLLTRNLLYTALTRARRQVVCLGRRETVAAMVQNNRDMRRYTALAVRLREWQALQR